MTTHASRTVKPESSPVRESLQFPLAIRIEPHLRDHRFNGRVILSAVEILQHLAVSLQSHRPGSPVLCMRAASFDRFLTIDDDCSVVEARHELDIRGDGRPCSRLTITAPVPGKTMRRTKVHAAVEFAEPEPERHPFPLDMAATLDGIAFEVSARQVYEELVPFGPAYRSLTENLYLSESGALGQLLAPAYAASAAPLGSPFPFDGAMHAACAWGQRFRGIVAFPVGFRERTILRPTVSGGAYICRVKPLSSTDDALRFDIGIYAPDGELCEDIRGVVMKDVFGGRVRPPEWVMIHPESDGKNTPLSRIREQCRVMSIVELRTVYDFAERALSRPEQQRLEKMGDKRKKSFLAGHLALKQLWRKLKDGDRMTPAAEINTVASDGVRPCCRAGDEICCSLSHDARFAIAVAADTPVGIDVEEVSDRILKTRHLFMADEEGNAAERSGLGPVGAAIRIWSIKEAVSKLTDKPLPGVWRSTRVEAIGQDRSRLTVDSVAYTAFHDEVEGHVFTIVKKISGS